MEWRGDVPRRHWLSLPLWCPAGWFSPCGTGSPCRCGVRRGAESQRHWLALPRGRGPSQTPKFLSPGPPSPWLPALLIGNRFLSFLRQPRVQSRGCKGLRPLHPGACPARHWLFLPLWRPAGGAGGGRLLILPLAYFAALYPPSPLPRRGRGRFKVYFAGGFAPGTPALDRSRHLQTFPNRSPAQRGVRGWSPEWQEMLFLDSAGSQGEGGPGERNFGV